MLLKRAPTLVVLLIVQSFSTVISEHYSTLLAGFLIYFAPMINNTGGSASSQTSALVIQGLATGELDERNIRRFILREFFMSVVMGFILAGVTFIRVYYFHGTPDFIRAFAISSSLCVLVVLSVMLGGCVPFVLKYFKIDPAHSAGPLLMTLMDIIGLLTFCLISGAILATW
jgi:magnesium transporter